MYFQTSSTVTPNEVIKQLFIYLYEQFPEDEITDFFEIGKRDCRTGRSIGALSFENFHKVKNKCGFSYANLYHKGLDHDCIKARLNNKNSHVPKRYSKGSFSSKRTSHSILMNIPENIQEDAHHFLQVEKGFYKKSSIIQKVSTLMNSDLLQYLAECHFYNEEAIYHLGQHSGFYNLQLPFGKSFEGFSVKESFAKVIEEIIRHFETSFEYQLVSLTKDKAIIRKYLTEKMKETCKDKLYSNIHLCRYIQGSFSAITLYTTGKFAHTTHEKCVFTGHEYCEYHVQLNSLNSPHKNLH